MYKFPNIRQSKEAQFSSFPSVKKACVYVTAWLYATYCLSLALSFTVPHTARNP